MNNIQGRDRGITQEKSRRRNIFRARAEEEHIGVLQEHHTETNSRDHCIRTSDQHPRMVGFREGYRMEAGIRWHLTW